MEGEIGTLASGVVAAVDPAADTETKICTITAPHDLTIKELNWTFANVVDAKAATGFLEIKSSVGRTPFRFPIGNGAGGAASTTQQTKGVLDVNIPVSANEILDFYMTMNEACVDGHVGIKYVKGKSGQVTHGDCNTAEDAAVSALTLTDFTAITIPPGKGGRIKKILVNYAGVVNAKAAGGYIDMLFSSAKGRHRYVIGGGNGGATNTSPQMNAEEVEVDIPVAVGDIVTPRLYLEEAAVNAHMGIIWVS